MHSTAIVWRLLLVVVYLFPHNNFCTAAAIPPSDHSLLFSHDHDVGEILIHDELNALLSWLAGGRSPVDQRFHVSEADRLYLILWYAAWCPHCRVAAPVWSSLAAAFRCTSGVRFFAFECSMASPDRIGSDGALPSSVCANQTVARFPTVVAYWPPASSAPAGLEGEGPPQRIHLEGDNLVLLRQNVNVSVRSQASFTDWIVLRTSVNEVAPCVSHEQPPVLPDPRLSMSGQHPETVERWPPITTRNCPDARLHDALYGLLFLLRNWAATPKEGVIHLDALRSLIGVLAALVPGTNLRFELQEFHGRLLTTQSFQEFQALVDKLDLGGLKAAEPGVTPAWEHAARVSSAMWLLFHVMSASYLANRRPEFATRVLAEGPSCAWNETTTPLLRHANSEELENNLTAWTLARVIRSTVDSFFGCDACRVHFTTLFDECYAGLCDWVLRPLQGDGMITSNADGLLLWLWRFHNTVTFRTAVERSADSVVSFHQQRQWPSSFHRQLVTYQGQDVRFPPESACDRCRRPLPSAEAKNETVFFQLPDGHWLPREAFYVSRPLVDAAVTWEKSIRGIHNGSGQLPLNDADWDKIEDWDMVETEKFLLRFFWRKEWSSGALFWAPEARMFLPTIDAPSTRQLIGAPVLFSSGLALLANGGLWGVIGLLAALTWTCRRGDWVRWRKQFKFDHHASPSARLSDMTESGMIPPNCPLSCPESKKRPGPVLPPLDVQPRTPRRL